MYDFNLYIFAYNKSSNHNNNKKRDSDNFKKL